MVPTKLLTTVASTTYTILCSSLSFNAVVDFLWVPVGRSSFADRQPVFLFYSEYHRYSAHFYAARGNKLR